LPAITGRPDVLVGTDHHHRNGDPFERLRQLPADARGIEQDASQSGDAFAQCRRDGSGAERMTHENDLLGIHAPVDELWGPMNGIDELGKRSSIRDPRPAFGQVEGKAMHAPGGQVHRLEGMVLLGIVVTVQHNDQGSFLRYCAQV
jgi:hypothetical protein